MYGALSETKLLPLVLSESGDSGWEVDPSVLKSAQHYSLEVGDCLVFTSFTPHGGSVNNTGRVRFSVELRAQCEGTELSRDLWERPLFGRDWDEVSEGARRLLDEGRFIPVEFDRTWERWRDLAAIYSSPSQASRRALEIASNFAPDMNVRADAARLLSLLG